ncbi:ectoine/hydroxyectoine ABC transporter substrate-binding protein EhuB [Halomonas sp. M4R1S46]|uniref:ectoine/hydroxyectoine ABC transporter substrate-binding protein EhuB n=1 Tax=Halomonas sp. M4R1S46 TaxID=2982692 RepID=UPI0021E4CC00|nr:ectoine/hydroxyectoine ABC transporter substrate-binding protein EhuB [Halomonas sp. M4R1S46]UYG06132.1 ectoine/hydroxyectoine ABC transporter substrate-binding protein EhuB [Halomonas sp. M4R1S46]
MDCSTDGTGRPLSTPWARWALALTLTLAPTLAMAATLAELQERGSIRVAVANEVPYGYLDENGEGRGAGPEVARHILGELGIDQIDWVVTPFGELIPGLEEGRFDMAAAEMAIRPARCRRVLFSAPNTSYGEGLLVRAANPLEINGYADFAERDDIRVAVLEGASQIDIMAALGVPDARMVRIAENEAAIATLLEGDADAYAGTGLTVSQLDASSQEVEVVQNFEDPKVDGELVRSWGAFTFPPEAQALRDAFTEELLDYRNTRAWQDTLEKHGFTQDDILNAFRFDTEWLCGQAE